MIFVSNLFPGRTPEGAFAITNFHGTSDIEATDTDGMAAEVAAELARGLTVAEAIR